MEEGRDVAPLLDDYARGLDVDELAFEYGLTTRQVRDLLRVHRDIVNKRMDEYRSFVCMSFAWKEKKLEQLVLQAQLDKDYKSAIAAIAEHNRMVGDLSPTKVENSVKVTQWLDVIRAADDVGNS